jgi:hypothetical protein
LHFIVLIVEHDENIENKKIFYHFFQFSKNGSFSYFLQNSYIIQDLSKIKKKSWIFVVTGTLKSSDINKIRMSIFVIALAILVMEKLKDEREIKSKEDKQIKLERIVSLLVFILIILNLIYQKPENLLTAFN